MGEETSTIERLKAIKDSKNSAELVWITPGAEEVISYCARVSNPKNQVNFSTADKLISYCIKNKHWSIFEQASACLQLTTSRAVAAQALRHKSFSFQEFSQRYAEAQENVFVEARLQDQKNRQNSVETTDEELKLWFENAQNQVWNSAKSLYDQALEKGIAKEQARFLLPLSTKTTIYMTGSIRSWIHYIDLRCANGTQKEHKALAEECKKLLVQRMPTVASALEWTAPA